MPAPDFKKLHKAWQTAKKDAKLIYDGWAKLNTDLSMAHEDVKLDLPPFPKFNLDLGPSLDNIEKKKDLEKNKAKAVKAVKQYLKDIKGLLKAIENKEAPSKEDTLKDKKEKIQKALVSYLNALMDVRDDIDDALEKL